MNFHRRSILPMVSGALAILVFMLVMAQTVGAFPGRNAFQFLQAKPMQVVDIFSPNTFISGEVQMNYATPGKWSDPLTATAGGGSTTLPDLGKFDLGLQLKVDGTDAIGYVDLTQSLVFEKANTLSIGGSEVGMGPMVTGSLDGATLTLTSTEVDVVSAGRTIKRQFHITGTVNGSQISGEYRETIWNYDPQPLTIVGSFTLNIKSEGQYKLYLPILRKP
jgi:hypothetical protein